MNVYLSPPLNSFFSKTPTFAPSVKMAQDFQMDVDESRVGEWSIASPGERRQSSRIRAASSTPSEATANSIPQKRSNPNDVDAKSPQQLKRTLRQRSNKQNGTAADPAEEAMKPLTNEERRSWKGWVELESDPVSCLLLNVSYPITLTDSIR